MGFGYLLIGYIFAFAFSLANVYFFLDIIGASVMLVGLSKLAPHGKNFARAMLLDIVYLFLCLIRTLLPMLGIIAADSVWLYALGVLITLVSLVLQFFILAAIYYIAETVSLENEMTKARRNIKLLLFYGIPYIGCLLCSLLKINLGIFGSVLFVSVIVFGYVVLFLNGVLIHSCYCRICLAGQESGARPKSRIAWLNKFYEKTDSMFDNAYLRPKKEKQPTVSPESAEEPGYRRVKRKKKAKRK